MKSIIAILSLIILVGCQNKPSIESSRFKTIMIKSLGEVETLPDMASFYISLTCIDKSIKKSKKCLVDKSNELHDKLLALGIKKDDILTTSVDMHKSYTWRNNSRVFDGYRSSTSVFITIRNIDRLDEIYTDFLENQNLDLGGLNYSHSKLDNLKDEAYINALEKSSILADKILEKIPESKKEILKIGNIEISASLPESNDSKFKGEYEMEEVMVSKNNSVAISKGMVTVNATLYVEYQIE